MKTTVIFHSADFDGRFCEAIARKFLGVDGVDYIGWNFGDNVLPLPEGLIYVMDLPVDSVFGLENTVDGLAFASLRDRLVWIDHHRTSIASHPANIPGYRIDGVAACRLAWQWFAVSEPEWRTDLPVKQDYLDRKVREPHAVRLAGEYDVWDKRAPTAELFQHGLRSQPLTPRIWDVLLTPESAHVAIHDMLLRGEVVKYVRDQEYAQVIKQQGFTVDFEGLKYLACNSHELDIRSQLVAEGIRLEHDGLFGFTWTGKHWRVSLYEVPGKPEIDHSAIAKKYGGGGHRGAAGFTTRTLPILLR